MLRFLFYTSLMTLGLIYSFYGVRWMLQFLISDIYSFAIYDTYDFSHFFLLHPPDSGKLYLHLHVVKYFFNLSSLFFVLVLLWSLFDFSIFGIFPVISLMLVSHLILLCNGSRNSNISVLVFDFAFILIQGDTFHGCKGGPSCKSPLWPWE